VAALIRRAQSGGGFAAVLRKGEAQAGTLLVVLTENGVNSRAYERMPLPDGRRDWHRAKEQSAENPQEFEEYLQRRMRQDSDLWVLELDIANGERLIGLQKSEG
jgi:hypothetical protein